MSSLKILNDDRFWRVLLKIGRASVAVDTTPLCNAELWTLSHNAKVKIDTFKRKFLKQVVKSKWIKKTLYKQCKTIPWSVTIKQKRLNWFGHLNRLPAQASAKIAFKEAHFRPLKKLRGCQPLNWLHTIKRDFKEINILYKWLCSRRFKFRVFS